MSMVSRPLFLSGGFAIHGNHMVPTASDGYSLVSNNIPYDSLKMDNFADFNLPQAGFVAPKPTTHDKA